VEDEFAGWYRVGGRTLQFYATDDEIAEWLRGTLPSADGPYAILGRQWHHDRWMPFEYRLDEIGTAFGLHRTASYWIRSNALSPGLTGSDEKRLAWNGLINVQLSAPQPDGRLGEASIGIVDRIRHEQSGRGTAVPRLSEKSSSACADQCGSALLSRRFRSPPMASLTRAGG
jgi:hypothetical protein